MQTRPAVEFATQLIRQVNDDEVPELAAALAYRFLFAIFPFMIFLAALAGFVAPMLGLGDPTGEILGSLADNLPPDVAAQIRPQLEAVLGETRPGLMTIGAVTALWAASSGIGSVIKSMNRAYDVEETRGFVARTGTALGLTILGSVGILVAFVTVVGGSLLTEQVVEEVGVAEALWTTVSLIRFPLVLAMVAVAVAVLFKLGPNVRVGFRWTLVGGTVFAITWMLATLLFGLYVANFANYANTYGALGGVVILMLWFYLTGLMLLVAAEVTAMLATSKELDRIAARREELRARGAPMPAPVPVPLRPARHVPAPTPVSGVRGAVAVAAVALGAVGGVVLGRLAGSDEPDGKVATQGSKARRSRIRSASARNAADVPRSSTTIVRPPRPSSTRNEYDPTTACVPPPGQRTT